MEREEKVHKEEDRRQDENEKGKEEGKKVKKGDGRRKVREMRKFCMGKRGNWGRGEQKSRRF